MPTWERTTKYNNQPWFSCLGSVTGRGLWGGLFKPRALAFCKETSSLSWVVRDGGDPCSGPIIGWKKSPRRWSFRLGVGLPQLFRNYTKTEKDVNDHVICKRMKIFTRSAQAVDMTIHTSRGLHVCNTFCTGAWHDHTHIMRFTSKLKITAIENIIWVIKKTHKQIQYISQNYFNCSLFKMC